MNLTNETVPPEKRYRISQERPRMVETYATGEWKPLFYCRDEEAAKLQLERCVARAHAWDRMTPEQRVTIIMGR